MFKFVSWLELRGYWTKSPSNELTFFKVSEAQNVAWVRFIKNLHKSINKYKSLQSMPKPFKHAINMYYL